MQSLAPVQAEDNVKAADQPSLSPEAMENIRYIYNSHVRDLVYNRW